MGVGEDREIASTNRQKKRSSRERGGGGESREIDVQERISS